MVLQLLSILAPIFITAGIGFAWARRGGTYDSELTTRLIMNLGAPCLVFGELATIHVERVQLGQMVLGALLAMSLSGLVGVLALRLMRLPPHTFLAPVVFSNSGNMGLPLCLFAFGPAGLSLATAYFATVAITHFTAGVWIWSGRASLRELARTPLSYAAVLAAAFILTGWPVPLWLRNTTRLVGGLTIPLMLLTLGVSLSRLRRRSVPHTLVLALLRLTVGFGIGVTLAGALGLGGVPRQVLIAECSMPAAVFNYIFAQRYRRAPEEVASVVVISTLMAFLLVPFLLAWLL